VSYDLFRGGGKFVVSSAVWLKLLTLASQYGWQPHGTEQLEWEKRTPDGSFVLDEERKAAYKDWDGSYFFNEMQSVTDEDALALAMALEKAADDIPDGPIPDQWSERIGRPAQAPSPIPGAEASLRLEASMDLIYREVLGAVSISRPNIDLSSLEFFAGERKRIVIGFIAFCKQGGFFIG
jgi:hypothetical protein